VDQSSFIGFKNIICELGETQPQPTSMKRITLAKNSIVFSYAFRFLFWGAKRLVDFSQAELNDTLEDEGRTAKGSWLTKKHE
jgi:hypothetical protein